MSRMDQLDWENALNQWNKEREQLSLELAHVKAKSEERKAALVEIADMSLNRTTIKRADAEYLYRIWNIASKALED